MQAQINTNTTQETLFFVSGTTMSIKKSDKSMAIALSTLSDSEVTFFCKVEQKLLNGETLGGTEALEYTGMLLDILSAWADAPVAISA
jgi:hypothetical protein